MDEKLQSSRRQANKQKGNDNIRAGLMSPSPSKKRTSKLDKPMTFKEMREQERMDASAYIAPGANHVEKKFGDLPNQKVDFGSKYKFEPKQGPGPGSYNNDPAQKHVKPFIYEARIYGKYNKDSLLVDEFRNRNEIANDPGRYSNHLKSFGDDVRSKVGFGEKPAFKPKEGPEAGRYDPTDT